MKYLLIIAVLFVGSAFSQDSSKDCMDFIYNDDPTGYMKCLDGEINPKPKKKKKDEHWVDGSGLPVKYSKGEYNFVLVGASTKENVAVFYASQNLRGFPASWYSNTEEIEFVTIRAPWVDDDGKPNSFEKIISTRLFVNCSSKKWGYTSKTEKNILAYNSSKDDDWTNRFASFYC